MQITEKSSFSRLNHLRRYAIFPKGRRLPTGPPLLSAGRLSLKLSLPEQFIPDCLMRDQCHRRAIRGLVDCYKIRSIVSEAPHRVRLVNDECNADLVVTIDSQARYVQHNRCFNRYRYCSQLMYC